MQMVTHGAPWATPGDVHQVILDLEEAEGSLEAELAGAEPDACLRFSEDIQKQYTPWYFLYDVYDCICSILY